MSRTLTWFSALLVLLVAVLVPALPANAGPETTCAPQLAAAKAVEAKITAHNARPHVFELPRQAAAYAQYNAEAATLNAEQATIKAQLQACLEAYLALVGPGAGTRPPDLPAIPADKQAELLAAIKKLPPNWTPPPAPTPGDYWRVPKGTPARPIYDILRKNNPAPVGNVSLRGQARPAPGALDPAYGTCNCTFKTNAAGLSASSPDHIIPLAEIVNMPNFMRLTPANMWTVTRAPVNYQWLSFSSNQSKSSRSVAGMSGVDPGWQATQVRLENEVRTQLQEIINKLLKSQGKPG